MSTKNFVYPERIHIFAAILVIALMSLVYMPGLNGPFMFDDLTNITSNYYIKITSLDSHSLYQAATSSSSGPLGRPVAMVSFALNYYFGDGFSNTFPFKFTNLAIHAINTFLVFLLLLKFLQLQFSRTNGEPNAKPGTKTDLKAFYISLALAIIWLVHPIQANPVHYIVQRMTTLSGTFLLLGMLSYLYGRELFSSRRGLALLLLLAALPVSLLLGMFSKENAVLLIPLIVLVDFYFYRDSYYWSWLDQLDKRLLYGALVLLFAGFTWATVEYALPGYSNRQFSMAERLMSEARILVFYLGLIGFPVINKFGLFHDYIPISTGLFEPVSTAVAIFFITGLTIVSIVWKKRLPYLFFGWFWFLIAHSLESSFIALELTHEHRNYVPLVGPLYVVGGALSFVYDRYRQLVFATFTTMIVGSIAFVGILRSDDWKSREELILAESIYHPDSPRAQGALGSILIQKGHLQQGMAAMTRAWELQPSEMGYLLNMVLVNDMLGRPSPKAWKDRLLKAFAEERITPLSILVLKFATTCSLNECRNIRLLVEEIAHTCGSRNRIERTKRSQCLYYEGTLLGNRGQYEQAIRILRSAYNNDRKFLHPLFGIAILQLKNGRVAEARPVIEELIRANRLAEFPRDRDLTRLVEKYNQMADKNKTGLIKDY